MSNITIQAIHIHITDHHHYADSIEDVEVGADHAVDAFDPAAVEGDADPPMPDEEPEHAGLDPQQEIAAAITREVGRRVANGKIKGTGDIITPSWIDTIVETILQTAEDRAVIRSTGLAPGRSLF